MPAFTIAASATTSDALDIQNDRSGVVIILPSAMTGTAVAVHGSVDGTNFYPVYNDNTALSITKVNSSMHVIPPAKLFGVKAIKLVSNDTEAEARTIVVNATRVV